MVKKIDQTQSSNLVERVILEAENEVNEESLTKAKEKLKIKLREKKSAQLLLNNIAREIEDIKLELSHELG